MAPRKKIPLSNEEKAKKKSEQAKKRLEKIKSDPVLLAEYKEKERFDWQEISKTTYVSGDYVLVKFTVGKKEYRYAAVCSKYDDEDGELTVAFLEVCNDDGTEFKLNDNDIADVPYDDVIEKLPVPKLVIKRNIPFYKFNKAVNVYEK